MHNYFNSFAEYYDLAKIRYVVINNVIWYVYQKTIIPLAPVKFGHTLHRMEINSLLSKFSNAFLIKYSDGFNVDNRNKCLEWYAVIKEKHKDLSLLSSERRSEIRRGLKNCVIERIDAEYLSSNGFKIFLSAFERYKGVNRLSITSDEFKNQILTRKSFSNIFHYWGIFNNSKLIGYAENLIYDNIEANYSTIKLNPNYLECYPSYALIYQMNKYYLEKCEFEYVNDGFRSILHQSNIQNFLIKKFEFLKKYTNLKVHYKPFLSFAISTTFPFKNILSYKFPKIEALFKLEEIRRKCESFNK
jgi:hypothetical protein